MKKATIFLLNFISFILLFESVLMGQNVPNSSGPPTPNTLVTLPQAFSPSQGNSSNYYYNYDRTWVPFRPITNSNSQEFNLGNTSNNTLFVTKLVSTYKNGWGTPIQQISRGGYLCNNIVSSADLRPSLTATSFLPYTTTLQSHFQLNAFSDQNTYYNNPANGYSSEGGTSYSQATVDFSSGTPSAANYMPGASFVGQSNGNSTAINYNVANQMLNIVIGTNGLPTAMGYYAGGTLSIKNSSNANGSEIEEYYDKDNLLVCKAVLENSNTQSWLSTYYVYNDMKQLAFIIPPAVTIGTSFPYSLSSTDVNNLCHSYIYDQFGQLIKQRVPGQADYNYTVYDYRHRPVLYQSPLLASQGQWKFFIYDTKDRVVMSGIVTSSNTWTDWMNALFPSNNNLQNNPPVTLLTYLVNDFDGNYPSSITNCDIQVFNYYDKYPANDPLISTSSFDNSFTADYLAGSEMITPTPYYFTNGLLTASKTEILNNNIVLPSNNNLLPSSWITNVYYYDQKARLIQTQTVNPQHVSSSPVWDVSTYQYNFSGLKVQDILSYHDDATSTKTATVVRNKYDYDIYDNNKLKHVWQSLDNNSWKSISTMAYDDFERVNSKNIGGVEAQNYSYNIRGQLSGINSDYVLNSVASPQAQYATFGCILNYDYGFSMPRTDGKISGITWRGSDVNLLKAYGYRYDLPGRLTNADFNEQLSNPTVSFVNTGWNHSNHDFTMSNVTYDKNGNILTMNQKGNANSGPVDIDILNYGYVGNQLQYVADAVTTNYGLGDFQDVTVQCSSQNQNILPFCPDYTYDADGNMSSDANKHITSITYNYQDLPTTVTFANGSHINNTYDASGNLIAKNVVDPTQGPAVNDFYRYWGPFVYRNDSLLYVLHDEGRARWRADSSFFVYDFFVKDHLGNVRSVVTAYPYPAVNYWAGYEIANANFEDAIFNNVSNIAHPKPSGNSGDQQAGRMNGADSSRIGTSLMLHVMAGDKFDVGADSYWEQDSTDDRYADSTTMVSSLFSTLLMGDAGAGMGGESNASQLVTSMYNSLSGNLSAFQGVMNQATISGVPHAYLNCLVFDENMKFLPDQSSSLQVGATSSAWQNIQQPTITAQQSGYMVFYMSNSEYKNVWMDHFHIYVYKGKLLQEQNYYPYGLAIKEGQSTNPHDQPNKFLFETNENHDELGLNLDDFNFRHYDYQIGRFINIDPMADQLGQEMLSPYHFCANDPANSTDPWGLGDGDPCAVPESSAGDGTTNGQETEATTNNQVTSPGYSGTPYVPAYISSGPIYYGLDAIGGPHWGNPNTNSTQTTDNPSSVPPAVSNNPTYSIPASDPVPQYPGYTASPPNTFNGGGSGTANVVSSNGSHGNAANATKTVIGAAAPALSFQEYLFNMAAKDDHSIDHLGFVKGFKGTGFILNAADLTLSVADISNNGLNADNGSETAATIMGFVPGGGWLIAPLFSVLKWTNNKIMEKTPKTKMIDSPIKPIKKGNKL